MNFYDGATNTVNKTSGIWVRAVRGDLLPVPNFIDNNDGSITDTSTGFIWQQATAPGTYTLQQAKDYITSLNDQEYLGYGDWRLPTVLELITLVDRSCANPAINTAYFPDTVSSNYWSSNAWVWDIFDGEYQGTYYMYLNFTTGIVIKSASGAASLRAVRGGPCRVDGDWCIDENDCDDGEMCVEGECQSEVADDPPAITAGPYLAAGWWPLLPTTAESAPELDSNYNVMWKFSDDFASCSEACIHTAEFQAVGASSWTTLPVTVNVAKGQAWTTLPVESLPNATYAFRFTVTDCASQSTQSGTYYFKVLRDTAPVITGGPYLAAGYWPLLATSEESAFALSQGSSVLWSFRDDYASCSGLVTNRAWYRTAGDEAWTPIAVSTDPAGTKYAYITLPVLAAGTYELLFDVRDCAGQYFTPGYYYFKVEEAL
jgi:hypothetical protein